MEDLESFLSEEIYKEIIGMVLPLEITESMKQLNQKVERYRGYL
jgi:hypothetical protein